MTERVRTVANLVACYDAIEALGAELSEAEWGTRSLCPDWTAHGVVAHLTAIEHAMTGWLPESADSPLPFASAGELLAEAATMSGPELHSRFGEVTESRRRDLAGLDDEEFDRPSPTPVGQQTYGRFLAIRVFDFWVHEQDIRVPLGRPANEGTPAAHQAIDEIHRSLGYIVGKRVGLPDGTSIRFRLTGPVERDLCAVVDGRARVVDEVTEPDVEVSCDSTTFALLACGRIDPQQPIDAGRISWSGDAEWGERAARNLRFTM